MFSEPMILRPTSDVDSRTLVRASEAGRLTRISFGRYVETERWAQLDELNRHRLRTLAVASSATSDNVFSHYAAASVWRIPLLGEWPERIDVLGPPRSGGRSSEQVRRRRTTALTEEIVEFDGVRVTSPARTVADLARILPREEAVAAIDSACWRGRSERRARIDDVRRWAWRCRRDRGGERAVEAAAFATDLAESVWESASRVAIASLGYPPPEMQHPFVWDRNTTYRCDFWWPEQRIIGEFDGLVKYASPNRQSAHDIVVREKIREDRLRTMCAGFVRWTAADIRDPARLSRLLQSAGLPLSP